MQLKTSKAIFEYWNLVRNGKPAPTRSELAPGPISVLLPELFILDWENPGDIRFRLAGTRVCTVLGKELRGRSFIRLWSAAQRANVRKLVVSMAGKAAPVCLEVSGLRQDYPALKFEMVLLPLRGEEGTPARLLGSLAPEHLSSWQSLEPVSAMQIDAIRPLGILEESTEMLAEVEDRPALRPLWKRFLRRPPGKDHPAVFTAFPAGGSMSE